MAEGQTPHRGEFSDSQRIYMLERDMAEMGKRMTRELAEALSASEQRFKSALAATDRRFEDALKETNRRFDVIDTAIGDQKNTLRRISGVGLTILGGLVVSLVLLVVQLGGH